MRRKKVQKICDAGRSANHSAITKVRNRFSPIEILSEDEVEHIHLASLDVLERVGVDMMLPAGRELLLKAGASVGDNDEILIGRDLVEECIKTIRPAPFTMHARNPANNLQFGSNEINFTHVASAPYASDIDNGRRSGNQQDFRNFLKLTQYFSILHIAGGYPVEPIDISPSVRHLESLRDIVLFTDRAFHAYSLGRQRNLDALKIVKIARGVTDEQLDQEPSLYTVINTNSPLRLDANMVRGIIEMSKRNQVVVLTPFTLSGAMAPVTIAGALTQQNAEVLAGLVISQLTRPGAPFVYGGFTSNVNMQSGAPAFGTPEYVKAALASGQLARRYGLPFRSSNTNAANAVDAQSAYESIFSLWGAINGHAHLVIHAAGWMEGGLTASFEKFIIDVDTLQMIAEYMKPIVVNSEEIGIDSMQQAGHGGHFFGTDHTQARFRDAFYTPMISDWRNFETWREAGSPQAVDHANRLYKKIIQEYEPPPIAVEIREELDEFVERRIAEGGVRDFD